MSAYEKLVRGAVLSAVGVCTAMAAFLVTGKLITNGLNQEAVGIFALALVSADLINLFVGMGLPVTMPKLVAEQDDAGRRKVIASALAVQLLLLTGLAVVAIGIRFLFSDLNLSWMGDSWQGAFQVLPLIALLFVVGGLRDLIMAMLAGLDRYAARTMGILAASLMQVVLIYLWVYRSQGTLSLLLISMVAAYGLEVALLWGCLGRYALPRFNWMVYRTSIASSIPLGINQVMSFFYQRFDTVLVASLLGVASAAVYDMVKRLPMVLNRILNALLVPYLPHITRLIASNNQEEAGRLLTRVYHMIALLGYGAALTVIALHEYIILALFSRDYLGGASVLAILLVAGCILLYTGILGQTLIALGKGSVVLAINILAVIASMAANIIFISLWGMTGAGIAALLTAVLCFGLHYRWINRSGLFVPLPACLLPHILLLIAMLPLALAPHASVWRLAAPACYGVLCWASGLIRVKDLIAFVRMVAPAGKRP